MGGTRVFSRSTLSLICATSLMSHSTALQCGFASTLYCSKLRPDVHRQSQAHNTSPFVDVVVVIGGKPQAARFISYHIFTHMQTSALWSTNPSHQWQTPAMTSSTRLIVIVSLRCFVTDIIDVTDVVIYFRTDLGMMLM